MPDSRTDWAVIERLAREDVEHLQAKAESYGDSWCRRGGVDSFMMLARKWDRIERMAQAHGCNIIQALVARVQKREVQRQQAHRAMGTATGAERSMVAKYVLYLEQRQDDPVQDIADLRRYLLLVEERARALATAEAEPEVDGMGWDEAAAAKGVPSPYSAERMLQNMAAWRDSVRQAPATRLENKLPSELEGEVPE